MVVSPVKIAGYVGEIGGSMFSSDFLFNPRKPKMRSQIGAK
jgi:hypothetical protein